MQLRDDCVEICILLSALDDETLSGSTSITVPAARVRRGHDVRLVIAAPEPEPDRTRDERLVELIVEAHAARRAVMESGGSVTETASRLRKCRAHLTDMMRLSYLAPDIVDAILEGRQPATLTRRQLLARDLPLSWSEQQRQLGFG